MNTSIVLLLISTFSFLFGDNNVVVRHGDQQVAQGEFIGTYMNHVHILMGEKIIYYACDDIISITYSSKGLSYGKRFDYDCSKNTVTADILFPPELDPMTGEWTQMLPDVFNPNIPKDLLYLSSKKSTLIAGTLSFFTNVTGFGHLYASGWDGKVWLRSVPYSSILMLIITSFPNPDEAPKGVPFLYMSAYFGLVYDSVKMTNQYNIRLHNQIYDYNIKTIPELKQFESELKLRQAVLD